MRKNKKHLNFPAELLTPQQKLKQISLFDDNKYNFLPFTSRQSKINGWITDQNLITSRQIHEIIQPQSAIIFGKAISTPRQKVNINTQHTQNKKLVAITKNTNEQKIKIRLKSAQVVCEKSVNQSFKSTSMQFSKLSGMKLPFGYLRKKSRENLSLKERAREKQRLSIQSISYPIFDSKQIQANPQREYNPTFGRIRLLLQHRKNISTQF